MSKYKILGIVNVLISTFFISTLTANTSGKEGFISLGSFILAYAPTAIVLFLLGMNLFLAFQLLFSKKLGLPFYLYLVLTFSTLFWFMLLFIGYFFASSSIFPVVLLAIVILVFCLLRRSSKNTAIALAIITLLVSVVVVISNFEEDYCWEKGAQSDESGSRMIVATKEDAEALEDFGVKEGAHIGISFRTHMLCHNTFSLTETLKERYFLLQ